MKNIPIFFTLLLFLYGTYAYADEKRTITLKGKIDPRLYARVMSIYNPTNTSDSEECLSKYPQWGTGVRKNKLAYYSKTVEPDEFNNYEVTIPIDFVDENKCGYKYTGTDLTVRRDKGDNLFTTFTVVNNAKGFRRYPNFALARGESKYNFLNIPPKMPKNTKRYFQFPTGTKITCFTLHYERKVLNKGKPNQHVFPERDTFHCFEEYEGLNGVDEFVTSTINIDIAVDENRCKFIHSSESENRGKKTQDYFRDYQAGKRKDDVPVFIKLLKDLIIIIFLITFLILLFRKRLRDGKVI